ncbi:MAG TPA: tetratricopeptide repeat protein [Trueperaceae bacterium]
MTRRTLPLLLIVVLGVIFSAGLSTSALAQEEGTSVEEFVRDGTLFLLSGDCELAQYYFKQALEIEPENAEALIGNGRALACRNNYPLAIESFQKAIEVDADNSEAYVQLALAYQDQYLSDPERFPNRLNEALRTLEIAEEQDPRNARVQNAKGVVLFQMGSLQAAQTALEAAVEFSRAEGSAMTDEERSVVLVNLGKTYRDLGNLEQALNAFRRAVVLDPTSSSAHNNLGNIHYRMGSCEDAEYELAQAAALEPDSLSAVSQLAIALFECGNVERSIPYFEQAVELPGAIFNPPLYTYLARAYAQQGRFDEAVRRAQQGALLEPVTADAYFYLGEIYQARGEQGDAQAAQEAYQHALELDPQHQGAQEALAGLN